MINKIRISIDGIKYALEDDSFGEVFLISIVLFLLSFKISKHNNMLRITVITFLFAELINTIFERVIDRIDTRYNELSKQVKDMASSIVLFAILIMISVWITEIYSKLVKK